MARAFHARYWRRAEVGDCAVAGVLRLAVNRDDGVERQGRLLTNDKTVIGPAI